MSRSNGFTLIEVLVVVVVLGILAGVAVPQFFDAAGESETATMRTLVRQIRQQIDYHIAIGEVDDITGVPVTVEVEWFGTHLPKQFYTNKPIRLKVESKGSERYPEKKTFNATKPNPKTAWYNTDNGEFCFKVPKQVGNRQAKIAEFNRINGSNITEIDQVD